METLLRFISVNSSFPTAIPTVLLLVVLLYWLAAIIGLVDLDSLDAHFDHGDDLPIHHGADGPTDNVGTIAAYLMGLGLQGVPFSIIVSLMVLICWTLTYLGQCYLLQPMYNWLRWLLGFPLLLVSSAVALHATALILRPFRQVFVVHNATHKDQLVGQTCRVLTLEVSNEFGQAEVGTRGASHRIHVWAQQPNTLSKNQTGLILAYDAARDRYEITALPPISD